VLKGAHLRQLGAGQALVQGGKRNADHRLIVGRAKANVNPQNFSWEKLRAPLLAENFGEIEARLAALPPASLRPRRVADHLYVCPLAKVEGPAFDSASQCVLARLVDADGGTAFLEHPYSSRAAEGTEHLLQRLVAAPEAVRFVAGIMHSRAQGLTIRPTGVVFAEGPARSLVQPWVDRATATTTATAGHAQPRTAADEVGDYLHQLHAFLSALFVSGLSRSDTLTTRAARELVLLGDRLGFSRLHWPLGRLAEALELKPKRTDWDWQSAGRQLLVQTVLLRIALDLQ
jgi:hypothetical protein